MSDHLKLIHTFYTALGNLEYETMQQCYHEEATFEDPAFGKLNCEEVKEMWKMLCLSVRAFSLSIEQASTDGDSGASHVIACYLFSQTGRQVVNHIHTTFRFKEGRILEQKDTFDLWKWSRQALGAPGWLFGWSSFFQKEIRKKAKKRLEKFMMRSTS